jgi:alpha-1,6-mannosyltransferase
VPLAAAAGDTRFRTAATAICAVLAIVLPATGNTFDGRTFVLPYTYVAAVIAVILAVAVTYRRFPRQSRQQDR